MQRSQWSLPKAEACWRPNNEPGWQRQIRREISKAKRQPRPQVVSALASPYAFGNAQATVTPSASKAEAAEEAFEKEQEQKAIAASKAEAAEEASGARGSSTVETAEEQWRQQRSQWSLPKAEACWRPKNELGWHREWRRAISKAKKQPKPQVVSVLASPYAFGTAQATVTPW